MRRDRMLKKTAALLISGAMSVACLPATALADDGSSDIKEEKTGSSDSDKVPLDDEDIQEANDLIGNVVQKKGTTGDRTFDGVTYHDFFEGNGQEAMKTIDSRELFKKVLTTNVPDKGNALSAVWGPAAAAALLSGGYNKFYYVDDYWNPDTFDKAFVNWYTTWCWYDSNTSSSVVERFKDGDSLQYALDFASVADAMKQSVKDNSEYVYKGLDGNMDAYNDITHDFVSPDDDYYGDILYSLYTKVIHRGAEGDRSSGHLGYAWDCFALCFYDFKIAPLYDAVEIGEDDSENVYYEVLSEENKSAAFATNDSAEDITIDKVRSDSTTTTTSNTVSVSSSLSFTEGGSFDITYNMSEDPTGVFKDKLSIDFGFSATQTTTSSESRTSGSSQTHTETFEVKGTARPGTQICLNQSSATAKGAISYSCPVTFSYKVAVLSLCGDYSGALPYCDVNVKHAGVARVFGKDNGDAMEDVKDRYVNRDYDDFGLVWDYSLNEDYLKNHRFYSSVGGTTTLIVHNDLSSITPLTPLHKLDRTEIESGANEYTIVLSEDRPDRNKINLDSVDVRGISLLGDGTAVDYYGFTKESGSWKFCDENGMLLDGSECAQIQSTLSGTFLVAQKASKVPVYVKYCIDDDRYPAFPGVIEKDGIYLKDSDLSSSAVVEVFIYDNGNEGTEFEVIEPVGPEDENGSSSEETGDNTPAVLLALLAATSATVTAVLKKRRV